MPRLNLFVNMDNFVETELSYTDWLKTQPNALRKTEATPSVELPKTDATPTSNDYDDDDEPPPRYDEHDNYEKDPPPGYDEYEKGGAKSRKNRKYRKNKSRRCRKSKRRNNKQRRRKTRR